MSIHSHIMSLTTRRSMTFMAAIMAVVLSTASFGHGEAAHAGKRINLPAHDTPKGKQCDEPPGIMRKKHMDLIVHKRDKTLREGVRTTKYSLKNCVACHADPKTGSVLIKADGTKGFCAACHSYTAVKIDCFSCHNDKANQSKVGMGAGGARMTATAPANHKQGAAQ